MMTIAVDYSYLLLSLLQTLQSSLAWIGWSDADDRLRLTKLLATLLGRTKAETAWKVSQSSQHLFLWRLSGTTMHPSSGVSASSLENFEKACQQ